MKKINLTFLALLFAAVLFAQNPEKKWAIGVGPGLDRNLNNKDDNLMVNLYLSRYLSPSFDLMMDTRTAFEGSRWEMKGWDLVNPLLNLRYKLSNGYIFKENSAIQPYLFGGVGYMWDNHANGATFDGGAGLKFPISPNTSLYIAGSYVKGIEGTRIVDGTSKKVTENHLQVTSIIEFAFGSSKDSDGDGISDGKDECPDTPAGIGVDKKGCPADRDGDGISDLRDKCPDQAGPKHLNGCPDKDGDGIADIDDKCPDTPGLKKFNGCPDSDSDGVADKTDKCPGTPKGSRVDANGCLLEADSDNDGVADKNDKCPNTPARCAVDAKGCPLDSDNDGVIDCKDNCPSVAGIASNNGCPANKKVEMGPVYFDYDKDVLNSKAKSVLNEVVNVLKSSNGYNVVVEGHTDNAGSNTYNQQLSERRTKAVAEYLTGKGIKNVTIGNSYGETKSAVPNISESNMQKNRRVELKIDLK